MSSDGLDYVDRATVVRPPAHHHRVRQRSSRHGMATYTTTSRLVMLFCGTVCQLDDYRYGHDPDDDDVGVRL